MTPLVSVPSATGLLNVSRSFIYQLCANGQLPHLRVGSRILFRPESLESWVQQQEMQGGESNRRATKGGGLNL
jgi:excisionase family DNA binding protein